MYPHWRWNYRNRLGKQKKVKLRSSLVVASPIYSPIIEQLSGEPLETALKYTSEESDTDLPKPPDDDTDAAELFLQLQPKVGEKHVEEVAVDADLINDIFDDSSSQGDVKTSSEETKILYNIEEDSFGFDCACKGGDRVFWSLLEKSLSCAPSVKHQKFCLLQSEKNDETMMGSHSDQLLSPDDTIDDAEFKEIFPETTGEITLITCRYRSHSPHSNGSRSRRYRNCPVHIRFKSSSSDSDE
ncbi:hypothetical protein TTRE_0000448201 [Trichuris trichiura]|uniref:Uncharacterized protein n=1 Tax=Trichuris trichiura TaxID=36087 RepID=A0A077Z6Z5_TRITR|nr:hypothetical protein TTRE_0000448201 [Trichuris trichiura]